MSGRVTEVARLIRSQTNRTRTFYEDGMVKRIRNKDISTADCASLSVSAKDEQAWKYPNGKILRYPTMTFPSNAAAVDHKDPTQARRKQESNFFITINTNLSDDDPTDALKALSETVAQLHETAYMAQYFKFGPVDAHYEADKFSDVISGTDWNANVELGPYFSRVHAHIWLTIHHYSQVQLNPQMLMMLSKRLYNANIDSGRLQAKKITRRPYVHIKLLPQSDWTSCIRQYIHKGMQAETV